MTATIARRLRPLMHRIRRARNIAPSAERTLVVVPSAALRPAIANILARVRVALPNADILVLDDSSDGTADCAERLARHLGHISVLREPASNDPIGSADPATVYGRSHGYELLLTLGSSVAGRQSRQTATEDDPLDNRSNPSPPVRPRAHDGFGPSGRRSANERAAEAGVTASTLCRLSCCSTSPKSLLGVDPDCPSR